MRTRLNARFAIPLLVAAAIAAGCGNAATQKGVVGHSSDVQPVSMVVAQSLAPLEVAQVAEAPAPTPRPTVYIVPANGSLSAAAASAEIWNDGSRWRRLCDANPEISNPNLVFEGQHLRIPDEAETVQPRAACELPVAVPARSAATVAKSVGSSSQAARTSTASATSTTGDASWAYYKPRIGGCESNGSPTAPINYVAHNASGASGGYQFMPGTWAGRYGVTNAEDAAPSQQDAAADELYASSGLGPWSSSRACWG